MPGPPTAAEQQPGTELGSESAWLCASCLGSLGLFGNNLFQLAACHLLARGCGLKLLIPSNFKYHYLFQHSDLWEGVAPDIAHSTDLPLIIDRVVMSHVGFRAWATTTATYKSIAQHLNGSSASGLSGRQLRREFPQISAEDLALIPPTACTSCTQPHAPSCVAEPGVAALRLRLAGCGAWGWFQFHTSHLAPHREELREVLSVRADLTARLHVALSLALRLCCPRARRLVVVHLRLLDFTHLQQPSAAAHDAAAPDATAAASAGPPSGPGLGFFRAEPPFEEGQRCQAHWDSTAGLNFSTPVAWLVNWLDDIGFWVDDDALWLCTDDPELAKRPMVGHVQALSWQHVLRVHTHIRAQGGGSCDVASGGCSGGSGPACDPGSSDEAHGGGGGGGRGGRVTAACDDDEDVRQLLFGLAVAAEEPLLADWFTMQEADVLAISNSTFSFTAAMLGKRGAVCYRPQPATRGLAVFDAWNATPLLPTGPTPDNHSFSRTGS